MTKRKTNAKPPASTLPLRLLLLLANSFYADAVANVTHRRKVAMNTLARTPAGMHADDKQIRRVSVENMVVHFAAVEDALEYLRRQVSPDIFRVIEVTVTATIAAMESKGTRQVAELAPIVRNLQQRKANNARAVKQANDGKKRSVEGRNNTMREQAKKLIANGTTTKSGAARFLFEKTTLTGDLSLRQIRTILNKTEAF